MNRWTPAGLWLLFTIVAVTSGLLALALVGQAVTATRGPILSAAEVDAKLAVVNSPASARPHLTQSSERSHTSKPEPTRSEEPTSQQSEPPTTEPSDGQTTPEPTHAHATKSSSPNTVRTIGSRGGTVVAQCTAGQVYLRSWSPASGFHVDEVQRGPGSQAAAKFVSSSTEVTLQVRCSRGVPVGAQETGGDGHDSEADRSWSGPTGGGD
jgi:hypothetical protein